MSETIRDWSRANPWHVPIMVMIEAKDGPVADPGLGMFASRSLLARLFRALDAEIGPCFPTRTSPRPTGCAGDTTRSGAIQSDGWPPWASAERCCSRSTTRTRN